MRPGSIGSTQKKFLHLVKVKLSTLVTPLGQEAPGFVGSKGIIQPVQGSINRTNLIPALDQSELTGTQHAGPQNLRAGVAELSAREANHLVYLSRIVTLLISGYALEICLH
jgi:hypothetical protein